MKAFYWFTLFSTAGLPSRFAYPTFRAAWARARQNGDPQIWFQDEQGEKHKCEPIRGQEGDDESLYLDAEQAS